MWWIFNLYVSDCSRFCPYRPSVPATWNSSRAFPWIMRPPRLPQIAVAQLSLGHENVVAIREPFFRTLCLHVGNKKYFCAKNCLKDSPINQKGFPLCFLSLKEKWPSENNHLSPGMESLSRAGSLIFKTDSCLRELVTHSPCNQSGFYRHYPRLPVGHSSRRRMGIL